MSSRPQTRSNPWPRAKAAEPTVAEIGDDTAPLARPLAIETTERTMNPRAAFYARVSTSAQEQEQTITSQVEALERAAAAMGVTVSPERRYLDEGLSGARLDRPALDALRDAVADGFVDLIFIHDPDRLARHYVYQQILLEEFTKHDARVHFVVHPIGERAEDRMLLQMQGVIAEYERAKIIERMRRGKIHKIRSGQMLPFQQPPYGYAILRTPEAPKGVVVIDDVEAENVRAMYRWVKDEGLTLWQVTKRLNEMGAKPRKKSFWVQSSVYHVLTNPAYTGFAVYGRRESCEPKRPRHPGEYRKNALSSYHVRPESQWLRVPIPPIIDEATRRDVLARLTASKRWAPRSTKHDYLLHSMVVCGECGWRMSCIHQQFGDHHYEYFSYACTHRNPIVTGRDKRCASTRVPADTLDSIVWKAIAEWIQNPEMLLTELEVWRSRRSEPVQVARERARAQRIDRQLGLQIDRLVDAYQRGALTVDELKARRERIEQDRAARRQHLEELVAEQRNAIRLDQLFEDVAAFAATLQVGLDALDFADRQRLVRLLTERVVVKGDHVTIEHAIPLSGRFSGLSLRSKKERASTRRPLKARAMVAAKPLPPPHIQLVLSINPPMGASCGRSQPK